MENNYGNYYRDLCSELERKMHKANKEIEQLKQEQEKMENSLWKLSYNWNTLAKLVICIGIILTILVAAFFVTSAAL